MGEHRADRHQVITVKRAVNAPVGALSNRLEPRCNRGAWQTLPQPPGQKQGRSAPRLSLCRSVGASIWFAAGRDTMAQLSHGGMLRLSSRPPRLKGRDSQVGETRFRPDLHGVSRQSLGQPSNVRRHVRRDWLENPKPITCQSDHAFEQHQRHTTCLECHRVIASPLQRGVPRAYPILWAWPRACRRGLPQPARPSRAWTDQVRWRNGFGACSYRFGRRLNRDQMGCAMPWRIAVGSF